MAIGSRAFQLVADVRQFQEGAVLSRKELSLLKAVLHETATDVQQYAAGFDSLNMLLHKGALSVEEYRTAYQKLREETIDKASIEAQAKAMEEEARARDEAAAAAARYDQQLQSIADGVYRDLQTEEEKLIERMGQIKAAYAAGKLEEDAFNRSTEALKGKLADLQVPLAEVVDIYEAKLAPAQKKADELTRGALTPLQLYRQKLADIAEAQHLMSPESHAAALAKARQEYLQSIPIVGRFASLLTPMGATLTAIGAAGVAGAAGLIAIRQAAAAAADKIRDQWHAIDDTLASSEKLGISAAAFQNIAEAANVANMETSAVSPAIEKMLDSIVKAANGSEKFRFSFGSLRLDAEKLKQESPDKALERILHSLEGIENKATRVNIARQIFGNADILRLSADQIREADERLQKFNGHIEDLDSERFNQFDEAWKRLGSDVEAVWRRIALQLLPAGTELARVLESVFGAVGGSSALQANLQGTADTLTGMIATVDELRSGFERLSAEQSKNADTYRMLLSALTGGQSDLVEQTLKRQSGRDILLSLIPGGWGTLANEFAKSAQELGAVKRESDVLDLKMKEIEKKRHDQEMADQEEYRKPDKVIQSAREKLDKVALSFDVDFETHGMDKHLADLVAMETETGKVSGELRQQAKLLDEIESKEKQRTEAAKQLAAEQEKYNQAAKEITDDVEADIQKRLAGLQALQESAETSKAGKDGVDAADKTRAKPAPDDWLTDLEKRAAAGERVDLSVRPDPKPADSVLSPDTSRMGKYLSSVEALEETTGRVSAEFRRQAMQLDELAEKEKRLRDEAAAGGSKPRTGDPLDPLGAGAGKHLKRVYELEVASGRVSLELRQQARWLDDIERREKARAEVAGHIADLEKEVRQRDMTPQERVRDDLKASGATDEELARVEALQKQLDLKHQINRASEVDLNIIRKGSMEDFGTIERFSRQAADPGRGGRGIRRPRGPAEFTISGASSTVWNDTGMNFTGVPTSVTRPPSVGVANATQVGKDLEVLKAIEKNTARELAVNVQEVSFP